VDKLHCITVQSSILLMAALASSVITGKRDDRFHKPNPI